MAVPTKENGANRLLACVCTSGLPGWTAIFASATDRELAKYVQFLKEENKVLRARVPGQVHTRPGERARLLQYRKALGRAIEELITIVTPGTFYRWRHYTCAPHKWVDLERSPSFANHPASTSQECRHEPFPNDSSQAFSDR